MSDGAAQSDNGVEEIPKKFLQSQQSVWISHWTRTSYRSLNNAHSRSQLSLPYEYGEDNQRIKHLHLLGGVETEIGSSEFAKEVREMHKTFLNESSTSSRKSRNETPKGQHFPMFKSSVMKDSILSLKNEESSIQLNSQIGTTTGDVSLGRAGKHCPSMLKWIPSKTETQSTRSEFQHEGMMSNPQQQLNTNKLLENNIAVSASPEKNWIFGSTSRIIPSNFNGSTPTESYIYKQDYANQPISSLLDHEKKVNNHAPVLMNDPSTSNNQLRNFVGEHLQSMHNHSDVKLFTNQIGRQEARLYPGSYEVPKISSSFQDVETMRIFTAVDSVQDGLKAPPMSSQTTRHFLFTEKTDLNLSDGGQLLRESTISTKLKGKSVGEFLSLSPNSDFKVEQSVKLQPLDGSTEIEGKRNTKNVHTYAADLKNESSADTHTMDMDLLLENRLSGVVSSFSNKDGKETQMSAASEAAIASVKEETRGRQPEIKLLDINQELPVMPGVASSAENEDTSTSRTQSLDVEHFLSHAEHPTNSKASACADSPLKLDPSSRWVKRLKPSSLHSFPCGTKSIKMGEASSHEKVNKLFCKILNSSKTTLEPKTSKPNGKQKMFMDTTDLRRNDDSSSIDLVRKCQDVTLSHFWIQRWCHKAAVSSQKKAEAMMVSEEQNLQATQGEMQKRKFPSIAAMALMGKVMTGFSPCELKKRGSFVVWNTKLFS